ncbi:hypothetical protein LTR50_004281 [Elasticomyces elasticus]|nr:hypothetical protein LTR50_004281 [Elasticomyces elasticus]
MVSDALYKLCLPVLLDDTLQDEDKTEKLEHLLRKESKLQGKTLEGQVLNVLWHHKDVSSPSNSAPLPMRHTVVRRSSPAPWQVRSGTPVASSPRGTNASIGPPPGFGITPNGFHRAKSRTASPFTSPRPSPRLAVATPAIPHSPSLSAYHFSEPSPTTENYGDYGSDNVDWIVNDDASSNTSFGDSGFMAEWTQPMTDMSPYDMLRSIIRDDKPDDELAKLLEENGYDLSQTMTAIMEAQNLAMQQYAANLEEQNRTYLVGKSMNPDFRPPTPAGQAKSSIVCRYWLATGHCARADCRFAHNTDNHLCKYWMQGNCFLGDNCMFSHDPSALVNRLTVDDAGTPLTQMTQPNFQLQDYDSFPALQRVTSNPYEQSLDLLNVDTRPVQTGLASPPPGLALFPASIPTGPRSRPISRPGSRHQSRAPTPSAPALDDNDAFPSLGSAAAKPGKRHHGKRGGHGHAHKENANTPSSLADVIRMSPSPNPAPGPRRPIRPSRNSYTGSCENSAAAQAIPPPEHVPWLETGEGANRAYMKARAEAFRHGGLRNKFLQSAAQAWNRSDNRGAKALSLRGQNENALMREAHREAAAALYEERNKHTNGAKELYVDLHGLHPEEAVSHLRACLAEHRSSARPLYAICGTGHHSKNGRDKVGKAVRAHLAEARFAFREFSVPGDRNDVGGVLGIDPRSGDGEGGRGKG